MAIGLIILPLPVPLGLPLIVIASIMLLSHSFWAKRLYIKLRAQGRKYPSIRRFWGRFEQLLRYKKLKRLRRLRQRQ